jgi:hypothetical protein
MVDEEDDESPQLSGDISRLSNLFPIAADGSWNVDQCLDMLNEYLPQQPRAWSLCETYFEQASWSFCPIKRDEVIDEILSPVYRSFKGRQESTSENSHAVTPHKLATLFLIFALGTLVDLTLETFAVDAEKYYHLARAALSLQSILDSPEIYTVQAIALMGAYHNLGGWRYGIDSPWTIMSMAAKLAQSIGLRSLALIYETYPFLSSWVG